MVTHIAIKRCLPALVVRVVDTNVAHLTLLHGVAVRTEVGCLRPVVVRVRGIQLVRYYLPYHLAAHHVVPQHLAISVPVHVPRVVQVGQRVVGVER